MTLNEYLQSSQSKYAIIRSDSYASDPVAQSISPSPRQFNYQGTEMTLLSLEPLSVPQLVAYVDQAANGIEFELTIGSGKVTMLLHKQVCDLLSAL